MISKNIIINEAREKIKELEQRHRIKLSNTQKILLSIGGPCTIILDVLYGEVNLFMLDQRFKKADATVAELVNINEGEEIDYREGIAHKNRRPLIYAISYIVKSRCDDEIIDDLLKEEQTLGRILYKIDNAITTKINSISIESPTPILKELFKTDEAMLTREYVLMRGEKTIIWTKEFYPLNYFKDN